MKETILLVDDDPSILLSWRRQLSTLGVNILTATSIAAAIDQMRRIPPPDLVLLDLVVPPHGARETVEEIATLRAFNPDLVIIAISGMEKDEIAKVVANARVEAMVSKHEAKTQVELLRIFKAALAKGTNSGELLLRVSETIRRLQTE